MSVIYKVVELSSNPLDKTAPKRYYPKAITLGQSVGLRFISDKISDNSSLSRGDVVSVVQNFVEKLKEQLLEGKSVNIAGLGVFTLSLKSKGEEKLDEVKAKSVRAVRICFQASKDLKINKATTRAGEKLELICLDDYLKGLAAKEDAEKNLSTEGDVTSENNPSAENPEEKGEAGNLDD